MTDLFEKGMMTDCFTRQQHGATLVEYLLVLVLVAMTVWWFQTGFFTAVSNYYSERKDSFNYMEPGDYTNRNTMK